MTLTTGSDGCVSTSIPWHDVIIAIRFPQNETHISYTLSNANNYQYMRVISLNNGNILANRTFNVCIYYYKYLN